MQDKNKKDEKSSKPPEKPTTTPEQSPSEDSIQIHRTSSISQFTTLADEEKQTERNEKTQEKPHKK